MKVIGKDRTSCDVCNPIDEILARLDALERRASAIVAKVQGIAPDGEGNVTLPTSSSDTDPLHGRVDAFAMSSEVKEAADDAHAYAASIADDVLVLQSDVENLTREVEALDPASVTALEQSVAALQQTINQLSNLVGGFSAVIRYLEDQMPNKVDRTGDTMTGPLNVIDTATGSRNAQAVNGDRLQNDLDNYAPMLRKSGKQIANGYYTFDNKTKYRSYYIAQTQTFSSIGWMRVCRYRLNSNYNDMHLLLRFMSVHTTDQDFLFDVDVKQRIAYDKRIRLVMNASDKPLSIAKMASGSNVGLLSREVVEDGITYIEIWGYFPTNRLYVEVLGYSIISLLPATTSPYLQDNDIAVNTSPSYVDFLFDSLGTDLTNSVNVGYIIKGAEDL